MPSPSWSPPRTGSRPAARSRAPAAAAVEVVAARGVAPDGTAGVERLVVVEPSEPSEPSEASGGGRSGAVRLPVLAAPASVALRRTAGLQRLNGRGWVQERADVDGAV